MSDLAQARYFPKSVSVFQWRNFYVLRHVAWIIGFQSSRAPSTLLCPREVNSIEFLVLFYTNFPKDFGEAKQNCQKMLAFHWWIFQRVFWQAQVEWRKRKDRIGGFQSLLASSLLFSTKGFLCHPITSDFLCQLSWKFWRINVKRTKITGKCFLAERKSEASDHQKKIYGKNYGKQEKPQGY